jgi:putative addiction module killer protein
MVEIRESDVFREWKAALRDRMAVAKINTRISRLALGNPGDAKPVAKA